MFDLLQIFGTGVPHLSAAGLFFLFVFGTFISEDAACIAAGVAVADGRLGFAAAIAACFLGIFIGDMLLYLAGRGFGPRVFDNRLVRRFVSDGTRQKATSWLEKHGAASVFLSRFMSGLRVPTYLAAGALRTDLRKFALYFLLASAIWTPLLVGSAAFLNSIVFAQNAIAGIIAAFIVVRLIFRYTSWKNRRLLVGKIKRIVKWEFWPVQIFYAPVLLYVLSLAVRHRSLTIFTAANPAMPAGGFKGESKSDIYKALSKAGPADELLPYILIKQDEPIRKRLRSAWSFMDDNGLSFPLVIKPDVGERGKGVRILHSLDELTDALVRLSGNMILQQYAAGDEVSVFYYRFPGEASGCIFSITEKQFPMLIGDGRSTIEELVLGHRRACAMAQRYFEQNDRRLDHVPAAGEIVRLTDLGTHSRGAIFCDGGWLKTTALERKIDQISHRLDGFYFGRFDVRVPTFADLQNGDKLKIVELNGVTSESTNIYDQRYSLTDAYRILFEQWRLAFAIGAENVRRGAKPTGIMDLGRIAFGKQARSVSVTGLCADKSIG